MHGKRTIAAAAALAAVIAAVAGLAGAQSDEHHKGWGSIARQLAPQGRAFDAAQARTEAEDTCGAEVRKGNNIYSPLVGSWVNSVSIGPPGGPPARQFMTMETFQVGGTMLDRSEAPGNINSTGVGVWVGGGHDFAVSFQVFVYDPPGNLVGRARIRGSYFVDRQDQLTAPQLAVDFIDPSGNVSCNIAAASLTGTRIPALTQ